MIVIAPTATSPPNLERLLVKLNDEIALDGAEDSEISEDNVAEEVLDMDENEDASEDDDETEE